MEFLPETICSLPDIKLLPAFPIFSRVFVQGEPDYNRTDKSSGGIEMTGPVAPKDPEKARPFFYILKDKKWKILSPKIDFLIKNRLPNPL